MNLNIPNDFVATVGSNATVMVSSVAAPVELIIGILVAFMIVRLIIGILRKEKFDAGDTGDDNE